MSLKVLTKGVIAAQVQEQWFIASAGCHCLLDLFTVTLPGSCEDELQEAGEAAYLLALSLCQHGEDQLAQQLLARLGCSHRLVPAILQSCSDTTSAAAESCLPDACLPCVFQNALPGHLFQQLQKGLNQSAAFWSEHNYFEPQTPFFSYLYRLAAKPDTAIEAAIQKLHALLLQSAYGPCLAEATCAEWWAHCRESEEPHQLHFDMREAALRQGLDKYRLDHPVRLLTLLLHLEVYSTALFHLIT